MQNETEKELLCKLRDLQEENKRLRKENGRLKTIIESFSIKPASSLQLQEQTDGESPVSNEVIEIASKRAIKKVRLFRDYFQGREDVFAIRWENKAGKSGYSPACANEWDPVLCRKPCSKCSNSNYLPLTDLKIEEHLAGKKTIGIYPLLTNETCFFLAADFDKECWQDDVRIFLQSCCEMNVPAVLERSRSGQGGHIWIFFSEALPSILARKLGSAVLTNALSKRHKIGLDSYDRFFPSQDTMPKGGFGNLIALPLQKMPRENGNTIFLDDDLRPYPDQWKFLASIKKINPEEVRHIVKNAERSNSIIGVRAVNYDDLTQDDPWTLPPSKQVPELDFKGSFPKSIPIVCSNLLFIEKENLTSQLISRLVRLAAFQNPEFYRAQAMRLSTFGKPRIIYCAEEFPKHIGLPRGCVDEVTSLLNSLNIEIKLEDKRFQGKTIDVSFEGKLQDMQYGAASKMLENENGILVAPTGFGKTVIASWLIAQRKANTLILVHRRILMDQWRERLCLFLDIPLKDIGIYGGGKKKLIGKIDIAVMQSLQRKGEVQDFVADYGHLIVDECHHVSAFSFEQVLKQVKARYILGLTATPTRRGGHHPIIIMQCGPIRAKIDSKTIALERPFKHVVLFKETSFRTPESITEPTIQELYSALVDDRERNVQITEEILASIAEGRSPLVLTERTEHLKILSDMLGESIKNLLILKGGMGKRQREAALGKLRSIPENEDRVIMATGKHIGEGFDDARLDTLFLASPISWRGTLQQYVGRIHRLHDNKREVRVYDFVDRQVPVLFRMFNKRLAGYKAIGYSIGSETTGS
ncbi:MAG: DEAD/DEAH box helicase family protein [Candidatus Zixiibacteriota bacterium]